MLRGLRPPSHCFPPFFPGQPVRESSPAGPGSWRHLRFSVPCPRARPPDATSRLRSTGAGLYNAGAAVLGAVLLAGAAVVLTQNVRAPRLRVLQKRAAVAFVCLVPNRTVVTLARDRSPARRRPSSSTAPSRSPTTSTHSSKNSAWILFQPSGGRSAADGAFVPWGEQTEGLISSQRDSFIYSSRAASCLGGIFGRRPDRACVKRQ